MTAAGLGELNGYASVISKIFLDNNLPLHLKPITYTSPIGDVFYLSNLALTKLNLTNFSNDISKKSIVFSAYKSHLIFINPRDVEYLEADFDVEVSQTLFFNGNYTGGVLTIQNAVAEGSLVIINLWKEAWLCIKLMTAI